MGLRHSKGVPLPLRVQQEDDPACQGNQIDKSSESEVQYLVVFFKFAYFLNILPLRIQMSYDLDGTKTGYSIHSNKFQKVRLTRFVHIKTCKLIID